MSIRVETHSWKLKSKFVNGDINLCLKPASHEGCPRKQNKQRSCKKYFTKICRLGF